MTIASFIPTLWDAKLLQNLEKNLVYANLFNKNYEGVIKQKGDTVKINFLADITVSDYDTDEDLDAETLSTTATSLVIDQAQYFNFLVDDLDKVQAAGDQINSAMTNAAYQMADTTDVYLAGLLAGTTDALTTDLGSSTTPLVVNAEPLSGDYKMYELLVKIKVAMDKADVPKAGRWVVVPPDAEGLMLLDQRFVSTGADKAEERLANAVISRAAGFDIYTSNNVPNTSSEKYKILAGYGETGTYAEQIVKTEAYRQEKGFKDGMKGLHVYGAKVVRPATLAIATVNFEDSVEPTE